MTDHGLSSQQLEVICALSNGATLTSAAEQAGVHRNTINNWRRNSPPFQHGLASAQYDRSLYFREKIEDRIDQALKTLDDILTDPKTPASIRLKAALAIITIASTPPEPKRQVELDIEKILIAPTVHKGAQNVERTPSSACDPQVAQAPTAHNSAQPTQAPSPQPAATIRVNSRPTAANPPTAKIGRNHPCPCRSGKKYKHCCLNKIAQPTAA